MYKTATIINPLHTRGSIYTYNAREWYLPYIQIHTKHRKNVFLERDETVHQFHAHHITFTLHVTIVKRRNNGLGYDRNLALTSATLWTVLSRLLFPNMNITTLAKLTSRYKQHYSNTDYVQGTFTKQGSLGVNQVCIFQQEVTLAVQSVCNTWRMRQPNSSRGISWCAPATTLETWPHEKVRFYGRKMFPHRNSPQINRDAG